MRQLATALAIHCEHFNVLERLEAPTTEDRTKMKIVRNKINALAQEHFVPGSQVDIRSSGLHGLLVRVEAEGEEYDVVVRPTFVGPDTTISIIKHNPKYDLARSVNTMQDMTQVMTKMVEA